MSKFYFAFDRYRYWITITFWTLIWLLYSFKNLDSLKIRGFLIIGAILLLYALFAYVIVYVLDVLLVKSKLYLAPIFIALLFPVALIVVYLWIYQVMPSFGFYAFKKNVPFDFPEFLVRIGTEYGKLILFYVSSIWLSNLIIRIVASWRSYQRGFGLLMEQSKRSRMSMHLERNTLSFILYVSRLGQSVYTAALLEMYLDIKVYIEEVTQLSLPVKLVKTEMVYVQKMLDFYSLRYRQPDAVQVCVSGRYSGQTIPGLVLLTIIENVGTYAKLDQSGAVRIELDLRDEGYTFRCWNIKKTGAVAITEPTGRGVQYVREQLDTHFKDKYTLQIQDLDTTYELELTVDLKIE